jgi:hypothetical protein
MPDALTERRGQRSNQVPPNRLKSNFTVCNRCWISRILISAREPLYGETGSTTLEYRRVKVRWVTPLGLLTDGLDGFTTNVTLAAAKHRHHP